MFTFILVMMRLSTHLTLGEIEKCELKCEISEQEKCNDDERRRFADEIVEKASKGITEKHA